MAFGDSLNEQIGQEFAASQQYIAIAVLLDADLPVAIPGVAAPQTQFADVVEPVQLALDQEKRVTAQIIELVRGAREDGDFVGEQFLHWFLQEQREEVSSMSALLQVVERSRDNVMLIEDYLVRESAGAASPLGAGAPPVAGGAL